MASSALATVRARTLFAPLEAGGRAETVARRLVQAITLGLLLDGERLPAESQLARQFGVSPVTLREALAMLRDMGLVETRRGRQGGSFVRAPASAQEAQVEAMLRLLSVHELRDIGDHRAAVAGLRTAAAHRTVAAVRTAAVREPWAAPPAWPAPAPGLAPGPAPPPEPAPRRAAPRHIPRTPARAQPPRPQSFASPASRAVFAA